MVRWLYLGAFCFTYFSGNFASAYSPQNVTSYMNSLGGSQLVGNTLRILNLSHTEALFQDYIFACENLDANVEAKYVSPPYLVTQALNPDKLPIQWSYHIQELINSSFRTIEDNSFPPLTILRIYQKPKICINDQLSDRQIAIALIHELTHFVKAPLGPKSLLLPEELPSRPQIYAAFHSESGGELDAYSTQLSVLATNNKEDFWTSQFSPSFEQSINQEERALAKSINDNEFSREIYLAYKSVYQTQATKWLNSRWDYLGIVQKAASRHLESLKAINDGKNSKPLIEQLESLIADVKTKKMRITQLLKETI